MCWRSWRQYSDPPDQDESRRARALRASRPNGQIRTGTYDPAVSRRAAPELRLGARLKSARRHLGNSNTAEHAGAGQMFMHNRAGRECALQVSLSAVRGVHAADGRPVLPVQDIGYLLRRAGAAASALPSRRRQDKCVGGPVADGEVAPCRWSREGVAGRDGSAGRVFDCPCHEAVMVWLLPGVGALSFRGVLVSAVRVSPCGLGGSLVS